MHHAEPHPSTLGPSRPRRGRPPSVSRRDVADAAIEVGFEQLTMTAVAERLGVTHAALYSHVADRDDLVLAAAERLTAALPDLDRSLGWRELLEAEAWTLWSLFVRHPGLLTAVEATGRIPPGVPRRFGAVCAHLMEAGFDPGLALLVADVVYDLAADSSASATKLVGRSAPERETLAETWRTPLESPVGELMREAAMGDPKDWFGRKLELVLDGIATRAG